MKSLYESILSSNKSNIAAGFVEKIIELQGMFPLGSSRNSYLITLNNLKNQVNTYSPKDKIELMKIINFCNSLDHKCSLNWINVSNIEDMSGIFYRSVFNGDISKWNVERVEDMRNMFMYSEFNQDISEWKINKKCKTINMFECCPIKDKYKPQLPK